MNGFSTQNQGIAFEQGEDLGISFTHRNYRYRLKLRPSQHRALEGILESQRLLYNAALQARMDAWQKARKSVGYIDQCLDLTRIRADDPDGYGSLPVTLCRGTLKRLDLAFQGFFRRVKAGKTPGFPRFKPLSRWDSFGLTQMSGLMLKGAGDQRGEQLHLKGVPGLIRVRLHRTLPDGAVPKSAIFVRRSGGWEVSLLLAVPILEAQAWQPIEVDERPDCGIDVGIESFATLDDGTRIPGLSPGRTAADWQRRLQRSLARKCRGSRRRAAVRQQLTRLAIRTANRRKDHAHKVSAKLARQHRVIAVEKLMIGKMTQSARGTLDQPGLNVTQKSGLNRAILDQGWSDFLFKLSYKAESAGGRVITINPRNTSQQCSGCGAMVEKALSTRTHRCACGLEIHRDHNAARNILLRAAREGKIPARLQPVGGNTPVPRQPRHSTPA